MGTRGAFGVVIGEKEKIGYSQFDSYPSGNGVLNLQWLREVDLDVVRAQAEAAILVSGDTIPTPEEIAKLRPYTDLGVSDQSDQDWYCLTRQTQGHIGRMLECGYIDDSHIFPLDSLFCEWAYILDLDRNVFEVYQGFQKSVPKQGRWAGRKSDEDGGYQAVELIAYWPLDALPSDEHFLQVTEREE